MGWANFEVLSHGKDLRSAYNNAVENARFEYGHDSYNGPISTTSGVQLDLNAPRYGTKAFDKYITRRFDKDNMPKYSCFAVELTGKALKEYRQRHRLERKRIRVFYFYGLVGC